MLKVSKMIVLTVEARDCTIFVVVEKDLFNQALKVKLHPELKIAIDEDSLVLVKVAENIATYTRQFARLIITASYVELITEHDSELVVELYSTKDGKFMYDFSDHRDTLESVNLGEACTYARGLVDSFPETVEYEPD